MSSVAEVSAGLVVCCLPLLPRLFGRRNVRTRLAPSEPSGRSGFLVKGQSDTDMMSHEAAESMHSIRSLPDERPVNQQGYILKSVSLDQRSSEA